MFGKDILLFFNRNTSFFRNERNFKTDFILLQERTEFYVIWKLALVGAEWNFSFLQKMSDAPQPFV